MCVCVCVCVFVSLCWYVYAFKVLIVVLHCFNVDEMLKLLLFKVVIELVYLYTSLYVF